MQDWKVVTGKLYSTEPKSCCQTGGTHHKLISDGLLLYLLPFFLTFMMMPLSSVWLDLSLFRSFLRPSFLFLSLHSSFYTWVFLSQFISLCPWKSYWFNQATLDKMSSQVLLEFTQDRDFLQLSVLMRALWGLRDLLPIKQVRDMFLGFRLCEVSVIGFLFFVCFVMITICDTPRYCSVHSKQTTKVKPIISCVSENFLGSTL